MKTIYFITSNEGKLKEAKNKLLEANIEVVQKNLGYPEIQANTLKDVAYFGVEHIQEKFNYPFILEDAGLFIAGDAKMVPIIKDLVVGSLFVRSHAQDMGGTNALTKRQRDFICNWEAEGFRIELARRTGVKA